MKSTTTTADYYVGVVIGEGSFGTVLHGRHKTSGKDVAIKVVDKLSLQKHPVWLQSVLKEQRLLRKLNDCCPYTTVNLLASFHDQECVYMVLDCCKGGTLGQVILQMTTTTTTTTRPTTGVMAQQYGWEILQAIQTLHSYKIIHADLKPDNILLMDDGTIRLADFGSAVDLTLTTTTTATNDIDGYRPDIFQGAAEFAAPEIIRHANNITPAVDIWSFGCILHALWTGQSPFSMETEALVVERVFEFCPNEPSEFLSLEIPSQWRSLIGSLLRACPEERPAGDGDFSSLRSTWESFAAGGQGPTDEIPRLAEPSWLQRSRTVKMRDGRLGWGAFLI